MVDQTEQLGALAEEMTTDVTAGLDDVFLEIAVDHLVHAFDNEAVGVGSKKFVPGRAPNDFDDVPTGAAEHAFEFLNDFAVAANGAVEALQVAVNNPDEIIKFFAG